MQNHSLTTSLLFAIFSVLAIGCGGAAVYTSAGSSIAAGSDATISVEALEGGNAMVNIEVQHLPPIDRLGDELTSYVVWFIHDGDTHREGVLKFDSDDRVGRMMATTPHKHLTVLITAENDAEVAAPGSMVIIERGIGE